MTLRKSAPQSAASAMAGDIVRITSASGAHIPMLGARGANFIAGAFGAVEVQDDGSRHIRMHEYMPAEIRALQEIKLSAQTVVERLNVDRENELAIVGFEYLHKMSNELRRQLANNPAQRQVLVAALETDGRRIVDAMASAGYSVFEQSSTQTVTQKKLYISQDALGIKNSLERGENPANSHVFDLGEETSTRETNAVNDVDVAIDLLFSKSRVGQPQPQDPAPQPMPNLSPFMRSLVGDESIRPEDLSDDENEQGPAPRA